MTFINADGKEMTASEAIRELVNRGYNKLLISRMLGLRYHHVRESLVVDDRLQVRQDNMWAELLFKELN